MKLRLQVQLDPEDYEALKSWAAVSGASMSSAVRRLIREKLAKDGDRENSAERFLSAAGAIKELPGEKDASRDHDRHLYGAKGD